MPVYYPESMGDPTPSALGSEPAGPRAFIQASERIVGLALRSIGGRYARVYRIAPDQREPGRVASADPPDASPADAGAAVADIAFSRLVSTSDAARGTPDVLAERECRLDPATRELIKRQGLGALATAPIRVRLISSRVAGSNWHSRSARTSGVRRAPSDVDPRRLNAMSATAGPASAEPPSAGTADATHAGALRSGSIRYTRA